MRDFLRYVMIDLGSFARDYTKYDKEYGYTNKRRYWFAGVSINMMEIASDFFDNKSNRFSLALQQPFKYYHIPAGKKLENKI